MPLPVLHVVRSCVVVEMGSHRVLRGSSIPYNGSYVVTLYLTRPFTRRVLNYWGTMLLLTVYRYTRPGFLTRPEFILVVLVPLGAFSKPYTFVFGRVCK